MPSRAFDGRKRCARYLAALVVIAIAGGPVRARAQSSAAAGAAPAIASIGQAPVPQVAPITITPPPAETYAAPLRMPRALIDQWRPGSETLPVADLGGQEPLRLSFGAPRPIGLKEAITLALRGNPALRAEVLEPLAAHQVIRASEGAFDPSLTSQLSWRRDVLPTRFLFDTGGNPITDQRQEGWDLGLTKLLGSTNGSLSLTFDNSHVRSNYIDLGLNPFYSTDLSATLSQPLLRNFGFGFATIHVRMAEAGEAQARAVLEQRLSDFVLAVGVDYWQAVRAREALDVARGALTLATQLLGLDRARAQRGLLATLAVKEAGSQVESANAQVAAAQDELAQAQDALWRDLGAAATGAGPRDLEPLAVGNSVALSASVTQSLDDALHRRPEFAAFEAALRNDRLDLHYANNQTLPELDATAGVGVSAIGGNVNCIHVSTAIFPSNCTTTLGGGAAKTGIAVPYQGVYGDALNGLGKFNFYHFQAGLNLDVPLANETAQAELANARIRYDQEQLRYRDLFNNVVSEVENALSALDRGREQVRATAAAVDLASAALRAEDGRYSLGLADSHEVLQFQQELIAAQASQVSAQANFQVAGITLLHATGTLLDHFQIELAPSAERRAPWYTKF
ncbi:MAG TPA: TolC family protein [Candidatus Binataceae bacterium]|nr:TolC family protein [Candidatus Binataceae bacterium]